jgi:hypothetical protein
VLVAFVSPGDASHAKAVRILTEVGTGRWGTAFTSDYVLVESLTFLRARVRERRIEAVLLEVAQGPPEMRLIRDVIKVHGTRFPKALDLFRRTFDQGLSVTDCSSIVLAQELGIPRIATFDRGFRGFLDVVGG